MIINMIMNNYDYNYDYTTNWHVEKIDFVWPIMKKLNGYEHVIILVLFNLFDKLLITTILANWKFCICRTKLMFHYVTHY
jgi:hypothetical protein